MKYKGRLLEIDVQALVKSQVVSVKKRVRQKIVPGASEYNELNGSEPLKRCQNVYFLIDL